MTFIFENSLNSKYNELLSANDTSKEEEYLKDYIESFTLVPGKMGNYKVLEIYVDVMKETDATRIVNMVYEDWFTNYDYVFFIGYVGSSQIDVKTGSIISKLSLDTD